jgi:putative transposon-encoded protein
MVCSPRSCRSGRKSRQIIEVEGFEVTEKQVKEVGNSGKVYVPKDWINKQVKIVLLEPIESE